MTVRNFILIVLASTILTFSMTLVMYDSVEGLGFEQRYGAARGGVRG